MSLESRCEKTERDEPPVGSSIELHLLDVMVSITNLAVVAKAQVKTAVVSAYNKTPFDEGVDEGALEWNKQQLKISP